jgi:hypothetical protein
MVVRPVLDDRGFLERIIAPQSKGCDRHSRKFGFTASYVSDNSLLF